VRSPAEAATCYEKVRELGRSETRLSSLATPKVATVRGAALGSRWCVKSVCKGDWGAARCVRRVWPGASMGEK
jgi:hypothetical protein